MADPWCQNTPEWGEPHPMIIACYWGIQVIWLINITLGALGTYKIFKTRDGFNAFGILYVITSILFIIAPPGFAFGIQAGLECWYDSFRPWEGTYMVGVAGYLYGLAALYLFFVLRLKKVFDSTGLGINNFINVLLLIGLIIQLITPILSIWKFLSGWNDIDRTWALFWFNAFVYTNIGSNLFVLILFTKKILQLSQSNISTANTKETVNDDVEKEIQKKTIEKEMLSLAIRYMVCAIFAMLSSNVVVIIGLIRGNVPGLHSDLVWREGHNWFHMADTTINIICLYLQFPFGKKIYNKLCHCTHSCLQSCFVKCLGLKVDSKKKRSVNLNGEETQTSKTTSTGAIQMEMSI